VALATRSTYTPAAGALNVSVVGFWFAPTHPSSPPPHPLLYAMMDVSVPRGEFDVTLNEPGTAAVKRNQISIAAVPQEGLACESVAPPVEALRGGAFTPSPVAPEHSSLAGGAGCGHGFGAHTPSCVKVLGETQENWKTGAEQSPVAGEQHEPRGNGAHGLGEHTP